MKVYSLDVNIDVYGSDQNRANHLLKVICASNNVCVGYIVSPLGSNKWLLKMCFQLNHSFKRFVPKNADSSSNETSAVFEWVIKSFIQTNFS